MGWLKRKPKQYQPGELVRLVTSNDVRSMLLTTLPFHISPTYGDRGSIAYRPIGQRRLASIDPEEQQSGGVRPVGIVPPGRTSTANNLRWPRPIIIPLHLVPRDFDDDDQPSGFSQGLTQQSAENFFPMPVSDTDSDRFNRELWSRPTYRLRCHVWSLWQKHLKDWWFFFRYPLAFGAALAYAIATVVHLARSHP